MAESDGHSAALEGRMPVLPDERIFTAASPFLWSCVTFGSAIWVFMVGAGLAQLGDLRIAIPGYLVGTVIGYVPAAMAGGFPSFRYGLDPMDAAKATFGRLGAVVPLLALVFVALAWSSVVTAFIARGGATVYGRLTGHGVDDRLVVALALVVVAAGWLVVRRGPRFMESVNNIVGPGLVVVAFGLVILVAVKYGVGQLWNGAVPSIGRQINDPSLALVSAIELGIGASISNWPFVGGLMRLVQKRSHIVTPSLMGATFVGLGFGSCVAAIVAATLPTPDPVLWFLDLGGPVLGALAISCVLFANIAVIGLLIYFAAVSAQQVGLVRRTPWPILIAILLTPCAIGAFNADAVLSAVVAIVNYQAMIFVGIVGVSFANYFLVLKERIDLRSIFSSDPRAAYAFQYGVNWSAAVSAVAGAALYRLLYDPATLAAAPAFRWFGASIPAMVASAAMFLILNRLFSKAGARPEASHISVAF